ncbi:MULTISPECIES: trypco2 family protein [unclassified Mesorhizobium]|uniref:trypco2 family protein n=1 Tax=unclassified Mesorhizobium TaxID=325217 RepID=UPI000A5CFADA|nr:MULTISPECIES: trypco2 family protein [unclassified Mesorhizobium]
MKRIAAALVIITSLACPTFAQERESSDTIGLDNLIRAVVNDIKRAAAPVEQQAVDGTTVFDLGETQLELKFTIEKSASGKVQANFWGVGADAGTGLKNERIQTVTIKLSPARTMSSDGKWQPNIKFNSFDPKKESILIPSSTYDALKKLSDISKTGSVPGAVNATALDVATDGVVVNKDSYSSWVKTLQASDPSVAAELLNSGATTVKIPEAKFQLDGFEK